MTEADYKERVATVERELAAVQRTLDETAADDYNARIDLRERQRELQAELARLERDRPVDVAALREELKALERKRDELAKGRINVVSQAGGGSAGGDFAFATDAWKLNRKIDEATGLDQVEARIAEIQRRLAAQEAP